MPLWKNILIQLYRCGVSPIRWSLYRRFKAQRRMPIALLYYHRIADDADTEWTMSNKAFAEQIRWLRDHFDLISMEEVQRRIRCGINDRPALHITFDDGYAENCQEAIPLLVKERIPCTYFITAQNTLQGLPFQHDLKCGHSHPVNNVEQIKAMAAAGIEIGAHTYSHADLGKITDPLTLHKELVVAREVLAAAIGRPIRYFAFPFGLRANLSHQAFALAEEAGYEAVCSAYGGWNLPGGDAFHLQRICAVNEMPRMKNWLLDDPRKFFVRSYDYRTALDRKREPAPEHGTSLLQPNPHLEKAACSLIANN